jgi:hypothetical protein
MAGPRCSREVPRTISQGGHTTACHLHDGGTA